MVINKIENAQYSDLPFPYIVVPNIFSPETYKEILKYWPSLDEMTNAPSGLENRNWIYIYGHDPQGTDAHIDTLKDHEKCKFWQRIAHWLAEEDIKQAFFKKFNIDPSLSSFHTVRIITDTQGYFIDRHPDGITKVLSVLLYCPEDDLHPEWGTFIEGGAIIPFISNHLFAFKKTNNSFHWVNKINTPNAERNQILIVYEK